MEGLKGRCEVEACQTAAPVQLGWRNTCRGTEERETPWLKQPCEGSAMLKLTQNQSELSWREQNLQAAAQERQQVVGVRRAEVSKELLLPVAEGRLLCSVEGYDVMAHLEETTVITQKQPAGDHV